MIGAPRDIIVFGELGPRVVPSPAERERVASAECEPGEVDRLLLTAPLPPSLRSATLSPLRGARGGALHHSAISTSFEFADGAAQ